MVITATKKSVKNMDNGKLLKEYIGAHYTPVYDKSDLDRIFKKIDIIEKEILRRMGE